MFGFRCRVHVLQRRGLSTKAWPVVDNLEYDFTSKCIDDRHGKPDFYDNPVGVMSKMTEYFREYRMPLIPRSGRAAVRTLGPPALEVSACSAQSKPVPKR